MERPVGGYALLGVAACAALVLPAFFLPPVPIDETRYLAVAWTMHAGGHWLVPWLDGAPYPDKPPLLFWLINLAWQVTGVHAWSARLLEVLLALATLPPLRGLAFALSADARTATKATWLWLGCVAFAGFAGAVMFDLLLTLCVLSAWLGGVWLARGRVRSGTVWLALGLGLGILAKGPVSLLVGGLPALLAPWWHPAVRARLGRHYLALLLALVGAAVLALAWALPAARAGGKAYADAIFLKQTAGRVAESFAHDRGPAWYLPIVPLLMLPWTFGLGRGAPAGDAAAAPAHRLLDRFALATTLPAFLVFCLISGKQPHYLLPLLPALALPAGARLATGRWRVVGWRVGLVLLVIAVGFAVALARLAPQASVMAYACLGGAALLGAALLARGRRPTAAATAAVATLVLVALAKAAFVLGLGPRYAVQAAAARVASAQRAGIPLLHAGQQQGLYTFAGRLTAPIPTARSQAQVAAWATAHPDGWVISSYRHYDYAAKPLYQQPFLGRRLAIWHAADVAAQAAAKARTGKPGESDEGD
ncbi:MAG TPA: glycosyltransferase family 39 protein [Frateuria sp.]|uniref:ArnT family glycosyltransferase n=1 Tax=Frateuria sp. TaxID=2211372 RepID=UPI002DF27132|nr:glycosyltransferase family 39 protein [Frateuria sp.]